MIEQDVGFRLDLKWAKSGSKILGNRRDVDAHKRRARTRRRGFNLPKVIVESDGVNLAAVVGHCKT